MSRLARVIDRIADEGPLIAALAFAGWWGWEQMGVVGAIVFPIGAVLLILAWLVVSAAWMAWRYYRHNEQRSKWNAFLYLLGIGR